ncbi:hypothetical protein N0V84_006019 [Fusarium piperis]|uniref:Uncharacterized protein n=1 Tax=Fusarium piperis TaxID=1435070 RepID=A0A9W8WCN1_9HYPO|nr:hypothetical protein N0V84_006019 [Fusarium piperis]
MSPSRVMSFDWYESTVIDYIEPVEDEKKAPVKVEEKVAVKVEAKKTVKVEEKVTFKAEQKVEEKAEEKVTIYITRQATNKRFHHFWSVTLFDEATREFRTYQVRKSFRRAPCTLMTSRGDPGVDGVDYIMVGEVPCARAEDLFNLFKQVPITQKKNAAAANRQYIWDVANCLVAGGFITKHQSGKAIARFSNLNKAERQQVQAEQKRIEDERQKARAEHEKARAQGQKPKVHGQKSENKRQGQKKANNSRFQGNRAFPAWFREDGNN